jgi:hypothetical protein
MAGWLLQPASAVWRCSLIRTCDTSATQRLEGVDPHDEDGAAAGGGLHGQHPSWDTGQPEGGRPSALPLLHRPGSVSVSLGASATRTLLATTEFEASWSNGICSMPADSSWTNRGFRFLVSAGRSSRRQSTRTARRPLPASGSPLIGGGWPPARPVPTLADRCPEAWSATLSSDAVSSI